MFQKLKERWGLTSDFQVIIVMLVFSLAGISILPTRRWIFHLLGYTAHTSFGLKFATWLLIVFPAYQFFLLVYGTLLGQFRFFWEKEKKMGRFLLRCVGCRTSVSSPLGETQ